MARARNIKPGFFANEDLVELPFATRLLFIGLWTLADREGRLEDRPKRIKMALFPADNLDVEEALNSLAASGFLTRYEHDGERYIQVTSFAKHQNPHRDEKASTIPALCKHGASTVQEQSKHDGNRADSLIPDSFNLIPDSQIQDEPQAAIVPKPKKYEFAKELIDLGVESKVVDAWMQVRKTKKATNSEIALNGFKREVAKAGLSISDAVTLCIEKSWSGLEADWIKPKQQAAPIPQKGLEHLGKHGQATATAAQQWLEESNAR